MICAPRYWWISGNNPFTQQQTPAAEGETAGWLCGSLTVELGSHSGPGGKAAEAAETRQRMLSSEQRGSLPSACAGVPGAAGGSHWTLTNPLPSVLNTAAAAAAAAEHTLSLLIARAWPRSSAGAESGSRAIPGTQRLPAHSEGKRSERTAVLSDLVLEFRINISKITILNSKNSLSLWYLLVPNFWNSPGLGAMLFCARFLLLCIGIKDRSEGSLQHVPLLVCYRFFSKVFQKQNISHILIQWRTQKLGFPRLIDIGQIYIRPRHYFWLVLWGWVLFITLQTDVQGNLQQVPQSTVQHLERKVNETAKHSIIFCQNWDIFPTTSLWGGG